VKVLSGWHINTDFTGAMLWALTNNTVNPSGITASAYATAPYIYYAGDLAAATPADVVFNYLNGTSLRDIGSNCRNQRAMITGAGLQFLTYEAGQHLLGNETKQREINNDARMYNLYRAYLDTLDRNGVAMMNQFVAVSAWGVYGCWGSKEYAGQPLAQAHKYRALFDYLVANAQFDPNEPKYWELVPVRQNAVNVPALLAPRAQKAVFYWLNGRLVRSPGPAVSVLPQAGGSSVVAGPAGTSLQVR
jgi:hypothetical protein